MSATDVIAVIALIVSIGAGAAAIFSLVLQFRESGAAKRRSACSASRPNDVMRNLQWLGGGNKYCHDGAWPASCVAADSGVQAGD